MADYYNLVLYILTVFFTVVNQAFGRNNVTYCDGVAPYYEYLNVVRVLRGGVFRKGSTDKTSETGEFPPYDMEVRSFIIDKYPVTNARFWMFKRARARFFTSSEKSGWSWVFSSLLDNDTLAQSTASVDPWWVAVPRATWRMPLGINSSIMYDLDKPVVHVSKIDAEAFCHHDNRKRLPTEEEWEFAARGGLKSKVYPWGNNYMSKRANLWQGKFPDKNNRADGYEGLSPVDAYKAQNDYGLYDMIGNVWEWTSSRYYDRGFDRKEQEDRFVLKGGSYLDTWDGQVNMVVRNSQRIGLPPSYSAHNVGFRCVKEIRLKKSIPPEEMRKRPMIESYVIHQYNYAKKYGRREEL